MKIKNEQYKRFLRLLLALTLILTETLIFAFVWITEYNEDIMVPFVQKGNWFFYFVYAIILTIFLNSFDGLRYGLFRRTNLIIAQVLATFSTLFIVYLQIVLLSAGYANVLPLLYAFLADIVVIVCVTFFANWILAMIFPAKKTLVIYDNYAPDAFLEKVAMRKDKFVVGKVLHVTSAMEQLEKTISEYECVIVYDVHSELRNKILKVCFENDVRAYTTTKISDILVRGAERLHIFDTPLLLYRNIGLTAEQRFLKRAMDIFFSAILLVLTSPIFLISAIAIKLYDGGPVFFRQERGTIGGKVFRIHKFRSMVVDADKYGVNPTEDNDPRITPVGKILRLTRMDELPQLIDILIGDMSLVGPRPERVEHIRLYSESIPEFAYRLKLRGGLTGYAQIFGKYNTTPYDKLQLDLIYMQNYSLLLDIKLILMTVKIMFIKESTEGFSKEESQKIHDQSEDNKES